MKRTCPARLVTWALIMAMPLWFGSCKKSSDDAVTPTTSSIAGTWKVSAYKFNPAYDVFGFGQPITDVFAFLKSLPGNSGADALSCLSETKFTFTADSKVTYVPSSKCDASTSDLNPFGNSATWKVDGNKLTTISSNGTDVYNAVITGNRLKLSQDTQEDTNGDGKPETYTLTMELTKI